MATEDLGRADSGTLNTGLSPVWRWTLALATLVILGGLCCWQLLREPAHEEKDVEQERLDKAPPPPLAPGYALGQTFLCRHNGLKAVEVVLVRYRPEEQLPADAQIQLKLEPLDAESARAVEVTLPAAGLEHNQRVRFSFPAIEDSRGKSYRLSLSTNGEHALSFWTCSSEAYALGELLHNGEPGSGDLVFTTIYDYRLADVLLDAARNLARNMAALPAMLMLLVLPGLTILFYLFPAKRIDAGTLVALVLALSLATWPLLLLWTSTIGLRLNGWGLWFLVAALLALLVARLWAPPGITIKISSERDYLPELALGFLLLFGLATRLVQVRNLVVPNWVDSLHHTLITQLIAEQGLLPASYAPYLPVGDLHYHFGFHANAAALCWLSNLEPPQAVLLLGQVLNALSILSVYALASRWSGERWAGVGAALVAGALSYMPAYYVSWGRYTQLAGLFILPATCLLTGWLVAEEDRSPRLWILAVILCAGLALTHYRVLIFFALFWVCRLALFLLRQRGRRWAWWRAARTTSLLLALGVVAIMPWVVRFVWRVVPSIGAIYGGLAAAPAHSNSFPTGLLQVGWTQRLLYISAAGVLWGVVRKRGELALIPFWCGLCFLVANLHWIGLGDIWLIHNQSVVISFWLPVSVLVGWLAADVAHWLLRGLEFVSSEVPWQYVISTLLFTVVVVLAAWRSWYMVDVINPVTVLLTPEDRQAIDWLDEHLPRDAYLLVNSRKWQGELRVGTDAGYWIPLLAKRRTTMPSVLYYQGDPAYREGINELARLVEEAESVDDPALVERLAREGITHVYVGSRGGKLEPKLLDPSSNYVLRYAVGPARVYEFRPATDEALFPAVP